MTSASITGFHHVVLTVSDLEASVRWYCDLLGFSELFPWDTDDFQRRLLIHPSGAILGLTEHEAAADDDEFSELHPGLDHLAFAVATLEELEAWEVRFNEAGIEHSGLTVTPATGFTLIAFRDPDRIQLELYLAA